MPGKQCVREPAMSQATCELAMSQGGNKESAMSQRASNEADIPSVSDEPGGLQGAKK